MKKGLLLILILATYQVIGQNSIVDKVSNETCTCMEGKSLDGMSKEQFETELGTCLMTVAGKYTTELKEAMGFDIQNQNSINELGEMVGRNIALDCPTLFRKMMELYQEDEGNPSQEIQQLARFRGAFVQLDQSGTFAVLRLKDEDGSVTSFLWLDYFPGSEMFLNETNGLAKMMMTVTYTTEKLFDPSIRDYVAFKVIRRVDNQ